MISLVLEPDFRQYDIDKPALHVAGYDSFLTVWVYMQLCKVLGDKNYDVSGECKNKININFSFFVIDLNQTEDEVQSYVSN